MSRRAQVEATIRAECERGRDTLWTHAEWYEVLSRDEIEAIVMEYGFPPLGPCGANYRDWIRSRCEAAEAVAAFLRAAARPPRVGLVGFAR